MAFDLGYRLWLSTEAHHALIGMRSADRRALDGILRSLTDNPYLPGDYQESDDGGRVTEVRLFKSFLVTYWPDHARASQPLDTDHAVKEVRVVSVERL